ncbi:SDR family oxidoreductase [Synechococcus sp. CB0101]|uniref:NAD-dependent epimerase/dehydratase family protein n=1 Tax=Synechococcus sp. CB0101 TaxID=232348 RepID=UPI0008FED631|nr:NAD-dependent epimerase/dehydratase family protein [Synechococcus sp. CB0101]QCH14424.1 SDR family oxidoreductase [Synechococcus sp. CB0101]
MTKVLVTGASGFIGLNFLKLLRSNQINFFAPRSSEVNLCDFSQTHRLIRECNPEVIIHLASQGVKHSDAHNKECNTKNVGMFENLLKSITPDHTLCVTGSMAEYGFSGTHKEVDKCFPTTQYGLSKLQITDLARSYRHSLNFDIRIFRLYGVYGYGERPERLFPSVIQALQNNVPVKLSDCEQERDFVHVDDVCRLLLELSKKNIRIDLIL